MPLDTSTSATASGRSIIAGQRGGPPAGIDPIALPGNLAFRAVNPATGAEIPTLYIAATAGEVDRACRAAWDAFYDLLDRPASLRADLLDAVADRLDSKPVGDPLIDVAVAETGLQAHRLVSERERTVATLRLFASLVRDGSWTRPAIDHADLNRRPLVKPDLRRMLRPLGPVAVFGAGNFPLAYSACGGDTASALAAGCPVIVKGHPAHPGTGEFVAACVAEAVKAVGLHAGTYSYLHAGGSRENAVGHELVKNPFVRAVGFTGSFAGGAAMAALAAQRPDPIPVFAEMGSINPVFMLPQAMAAGARSIAERLFTSITNSSGQQCTKPGLLFAVRGDGLEELERLLAEAMNAAEPQPMLSPRIHANYLRRLAELAAIEGVHVRAGPTPASMLESTGTQRGRVKTPYPGWPVLLRTRFDVFRSAPTLLDECFGPSTLLVVADSTDQLFEAAALLRGSLTAAIFAGGLDANLARSLQRILEVRVGRLIFNGVTTGVEVCASTVHGGPFPATNMPHTSAVGHLAIERWCRPVCYQNAPDAMLPPELRDGNPLRLARLSDGTPEGRPAVPKPGP